MSPLKFKGELYIILANALIATFGIFARELDKSMGPITQVSIRFMLACVFFSLFYLRPKYLKVTVQEGIKLGIAGFFGYGLMVVFFVMAFLTESYANASVFIRISPLFAILLGWWILKEKIKPAIPALILGIIGIVIVFRPDLSNLSSGILFAILSSFLSAVYLIIMRSLRHLKLQTRVLYLTFFAGFLLLPLALYLETPTFSYSVKGWSLICILALLNIVTQLLINSGLHHVKAHIASILSVSLVFFGIVISYVLYKESLDLFEIVGAVLIIASVILVSVKSRSVIAVS